MGHEWVVTCMYNIQFLLSTVDSTHKQLSMNVFNWSVDFIVVNLSLQFRVPTADRTIVISVDTNIARIFFYHSKLVLSNDIYSMLSR